MLYHIILFLLYYIQLYYIILYYIVLYYIIFNYIIVNFIILYYINLCDSIAACISSSYMHLVFGRDFPLFSWVFQGDQGNGTLFEVRVGS